MEENKKHMCKFCSKVFPSGRSLGGHMRSHLINVPPSDHHHRTDQKLPKKKLPPLTNAKQDPGSHSLRGKFADKREEDTTLLNCKECGKAFHSSKALFGHMKSHSVPGKAAVSLEEDSWNTSSSDHHQKRILDHQSDNEATIPLCRRKRSQRTKRYSTTTAATTTTNSSSLTVSHFSPSNSGNDQQDQEEVALSLILLSSMDKASFQNLSQSSATGFDSVKRKRLICSSQFEGIECNESEVNSPKTLINKTGSKSNLFGSDFDQENSKFKCIICRKAFPTYQALGGHRASHKKFKGCCAPASDLNSLEAENSPSPKSENRVGSKKHECPICFKVFGSGQALGGHKRSHLMNDHPKNIDPSWITDRAEQSVPEVRGLLDLNLPAPVEGECDGFKPWWIGTSHKHQHQPLLGLL